MPESKSRKKATYTPPPAKASAPKPLPRWYLPLSLGLMIAGLVSLVLTYLSSGGFSIFFGGWGMASGWR